MMESNKTFIMLSLLFLTALFSVSAGQTQWIPYTGNPVLKPGPSGDWDDVNVLAASVLQFNDTLHMWYDGNHYSGNYGGIGHAWSSDGITWIKDSVNNPVLTAGPAVWDAGWVTFASVLFNPTDALFHMWYTGRGDPDTYHPIYIGHATSPDGSSWTKDADPALSPGRKSSWDDDALIHPSVVLVNDTLHLWYDGSKLNSDYSRIGHAISTDWLSWQKDPANSVLISDSPQDWDYPWLRAAQVFHDGWQFNMFYVGGIHPAYDIGYAYSNDGVNWTKYPTPVMVRGAADSWEDAGLFTGSVLANKTGDSLRMWYSGTSIDVSTGQIGFATAAIPNALEEIDFGHYPELFILKQNYPNPFNPSTKIEFTLPKTEFVELKIYNILGKEVTTLVSNKLNQGNYSYTFDGKNLASGVYYYQLVAGEYREVKKMILLR